MIVQVKDDNLAEKCDELLTKLIEDERKYNNKINEFFIVVDYFKNVINDDNNILLCYEIDENVVGYIFFKYINNIDGVGYLIDGLFVEEAYRNKGIAKSLISEGLKRIDGIKKDFIDIKVMANNKIAMKLYESFGFEMFSIKLRKKEIK
jgi:ribosomal protein S18 acetylase RimI-like enzyme